MKKMKESKTKWLRQKGFTLVEIMVAVGMMGMVTVAITKLMENANKAQKTVTQVSNVLDVTNMARRALLSPTSCLATFNANPGTLDSTIGTGTVAFDSIMNGPPAGPWVPYLDTDPANLARHQFGEGANRVRVTGIAAQNYRAGFFDAVADLQYGVIDVQLTFTRGSVTAGSSSVTSVYGGSAPIFRVVPNIQVSFNGTTNNIAGCSSTQDDVLTSACAVVAGEIVDGDCVNIKISNDNTSAVEGNNTRDFSIIARSGTPGAVGDDGGSIKADGSLAVGFTTSIYANDDLGPEAGNPTTNGYGFIKNFIYVGDSPADGNIATNMDGKSSQAGSMRITDDLVVGIPGGSTGSLIANNNLEVAEDVSIGNTFLGNSDAVDSVTIGDIETAWINPNAALRVQGGEAEFVHNNAGGTGVNLNTVFADNRGGGVYSAMDLQTNGFLRMRVAPAGGTFNIETYDPTVDARVLSRLGGIGTYGGIVLYNNSESAGENDLRLRIELSGDMQTYTSTPGAGGHTATPGAERMRREWDGTYYVFGTGGGSNQNADPRVILAHGDEGDVYRPSYIYNMPALTTSSWGADTSFDWVGYEIPTKNWVVEALIHTISSDGWLTDLSSFISDALADQPMEESKKLACESLKYDTEPGPGTTFISGIWNSGSQVCDLGNIASGVQCGDIALDECPTFYANNVNASDDFTVAGISTFNGAAAFSSPVTFSSDVTVSDGQQLVLASDHRFKKNIKPLDNVLDKLTDFRGVEFVWKKNGRKDVGFIAQELKDSYPEIVKVENNNHYVGYQAMSAIAVQAAKEINEENKKLEQEALELTKALCAARPNLRLCQ